MNIIIKLLLALFLVFIAISYVHSHGRLMDPIARTAAWRNDTRFPVNYNDASRFCRRIKLIFYISKPFGQTRILWH